jgi:putative glycerol-1-phosphate prenyltransferase
LLNSQEIYKHIAGRKGQIAILIDPEKCSDTEKLLDLIKKVEFANVDYFFVGGSTVTREEFVKTVSILKKHSRIPLVIFPGASHQVSPDADAILYLSLISGRNPDYLIGHHVQSANEVFEMDIEVIPTGYILIDGGTNSSVAYVSQTSPIPNDKASIILSTAKAGMLQGKKITYLDAGSGAINHVPSAVIQQLSELDTPIIVGGGIRSRDHIVDLAKAGANVVVIGNKVEEDLDFLLDVKSYIENFSK